MSKMYEIRAAVGKFRAASGEEKTEWMKIGNLFDKDGKMSGRIRTTPLNWDGSFVICEIQTKNTTTSQGLPFQ